MNVGKTLNVKNRREWRSWLSRHHSTAREIWLIYFTKDSGKARISYNDAVEEALCYGWIDSIAKSRNAESWVQRFSPRKPKSNLSEMNKERIRRLIASKKMTKAGFMAIRQHLSLFSLTPKRYRFPKDILDAVKKHPEAWRHYRRFSLAYRTIRIGWIDGARQRPEEFRKRLRYFIAQTAKNRQFGMVR